VKYCSHEPTVNSRLSDLGDDTAVVARKFCSRHVHREEFTQKPCGSVSVQWKVFFLLIQSSRSFRSAQTISCACSAPLEAAAEICHSGIALFCYEGCKHALRERIAIVSGESKRVGQEVVELRVELLLKFAPGPQKAHFYGFPRDL
jgi:hypothetical protein